MTKQQSMDYKSASRLATLISRSFAEEFFRLLMVYADISASESASLLDLHIKTAQDFLEGLTAERIIERKEVSQGKRPHYRYKLKDPKINIHINLHDILDKTNDRKYLNLEIRERKNNRAVFTISAGSDMISSITLITGEGRKKKERKINITDRQGRFLFYLPFPNSKHEKIQSIYEKSRLDRKYLPEIIDIIDVLIGFKVIEAPGRLTKEPYITKD